MKGVQVTILLRVGVDILAFLFEWGVAWQALFRLWVVTPRRLFPVALERKHLNMLHSFFFNEFFINVNVLVCYLRRDLILLYFLANFLLHVFHKEGGVWHVRIKILLLPLLNSIVSIIHICVSREKIFSEDKSLLLRIDSLGLLAVLIPSNQSPIHI